MPPLPAKSQPAYILCSPHSPLGMSSLSPGTSPGMKLTKTPAMMPSTGSDDGYDAWLCHQLTLANNKAPYVPAESNASLLLTLKTRTIPLSLLEIVLGLHFPGHGDTMQWAQWLMESAYTV